MKTLSADEAGKDGAGKRNRQLPALLLQLGDTVDILFGQQHIESTASIGEQCIDQ